MDYLMQTFGPNVRHIGSRRGEGAVRDGAGPSASRCRGGFHPGRSNVAAAVWPRRACRPRAGEVPGDSTAVAFAVARPVSWTGRAGTPDVAWRVARRAGDSLDGGFVERLLGRFPGRVPAQEKREASAGAGIELASRCARCLLPSLAIAKEITN